MERIWAKVVKTDGCWLWTGTKQKAGYGVIMTGGRYGGKRVTVTRLIYEITYGSFDKSLYVCHHCDNPLCVRPDHLFLGTQTDNMRDCIKKGRMGHRKLDKPFRFMAPDGSIVEGTGLKRFCDANGLNQGAMWSVMNGNVRSHKGYTRVPE